MALLRRRHPSPFFVDLSQKLFKRRNLILRQDAANLVPRLLPGILSCVIQSLVLRVQFRKDPIKLLPLIRREVRHARQLFYLLRTSLCHGHYRVRRHRPSRKNVAHHAAERCT